MSEAGVGIEVVARKGGYQEIWPTAKKQNYDGKNLKNIVERDVENHGQGKKKRLKS